MTSTHTTSTPRKTTAKKAPAKRVTAAKAAAPIKATSGRRNPDGVRLYHDGKAMPDSQNKLSSVAYYYTKGIDKKADRIGVGALVKLLEKSGADLASGKWSVKLPNGVVLSAQPGRMVGKAEKAATAPAAKTTAAKPTKVTAAKAAAKVSTTKGPKAVADLLP